MIFLANTSSLHVSVWFRLYEKLNRNVQAIYSVHDFDKSLEKNFVFRKIYFLNKIVSYFLLGARLFFSKSDIRLLHAHGASGYGIAALISGKSYVVTVYGSEIFGSHSFLYHYFVGKVLKHASAITVTSVAARIRVESIIGENEKTFLFHTGINTDYLNMFTKKEKSGKFVITSVRNTARQYRTDDIIEAYILFKSRSEAVEVELNIFLGNGDESYFNELRTRYSDYGINFISGKLSYEQILTLISDSNLCISFPVSDQLSSTLLECIYLKRKVLSSDLESYSVLKDNISEASFKSFKTKEELAIAIQDSFWGRGKNDDIVKMRERQYIKDYFSERSAVKPLKHMLDCLGR
ncbi:glycosyltransferase [Vibrio diabolicus]|uniref:glycosyltransferase n=1 Tax=Vibrio diabolicus TaxID=50719 RepID=UPI00232B1F81|nr:glycosyltransferase [Vibrio diabolicus]